MSEFHTLTPNAQRDALHSLEGHPGWKLYLARFDEIVRKEIEEKIFSVETSEEERRIFVHARRLLVNSYAPESMRRGMITACNTQIEREKRT